ncbi:uncharacterized protein LOC131952075 isoform X1 [Physella acuta]|uniref:uncharacterized protein LOC131952075 isoform X1 n=1 Tax=Physella acuta TaxID=109671 RepID=UPI0027DE801A|nr:uncharacterized protein LOC131952075 isoform X1 [Physella acuta]
MSKEEHQKLPIQKHEVSKDRNQTSKEEHHNVSTQKQQKFKTNFRGQVGGPSSDFQIYHPRNFDPLINELHAKLKALQGEVAALKAEKYDPGVTYINQPDSQKEAQARKLEKQLDDLHAQLRALRDDVTDLKSENNKRPNAVGAITETPGSKAKGTPQYLSPQQYSSPVPPTRPITRGANSDKENQPNSKPAEQSTHKPEGPRVRWSRDDTVYPIPKSDGGRKDSIRAFTPNGTRITEPSRILSPPAYNPRRGSKIMSPLTIFSDPSLPWPESARVKVKS